MFPTQGQASGSLLKLSGLTVLEKQVERLTKRIGLERLDERQEAVEQFARLTLVERCEGTMPSIASKACPS